MARTSEPPTSATVVRGRWLNSPIPLVVLVLMAAVVPFVVERQDILNLLFLVFLYMSMGQSWNILAGFAGQINLGHAAFFGAGALVSRSLWIGGTPIGLAILAGCVAAVAFALVIGVPTLRLRGVYFSIGTLGVAEVMRITIANIYPGVSTLPASGVAISLYQRVSDPGPLGSDVIDATPEITGVTEGDGVLTLSNRPAGAAVSTRTGHACSARG